MSTKKTFKYEPRSEQHPQYCLTPSTEMMLPYLALVSFVAVFVFGYAAPLVTESGFKPRNLKSRTVFGPSAYALGCQVSMK